MLDVIQNYELSHQNVERDPYFEAKTDLNQLSVGKSIAHAPICCVFTDQKIYSISLDQKMITKRQGDVGIDDLADQLLFQLFCKFLCANEIFGLIPKVCSRWRSLIRTNEELIYQQHAQELLYNIYLQQHKPEQQQKEDDDIIFIPNTPVSYSSHEFDLVGVPSWKIMYHRLMKNKSESVELINKHLFVLNTVKGARARHISPSRVSLKSSPSWRRLSFNSPITASPLVSTKSSSYLSSLLLEGVDLEYLPKELFKLVFLRELDLSNNKLSVVPREFIQLSNLQILYLANNNISIIEKVSRSSSGEGSEKDCLSALSRLEKFDISGNRLSSFPEEWQFLINLKELNISNNCTSNIKSLPIGWSNLSRLQVLWCCNNRIENLPGEFSQLHCLQKLVADNNHLKTIPVSFRSLKSLRAISLRNNPIEQSLAFLTDSLPQLQVQYDPNFAKHSSLGSSGLRQNMGDEDTEHNQKKCIIQ